MAVDLEEIWLMLNEPPSTKIYDGVAWTHPILSNGNEVVYHARWRNNNSIMHKMEIREYINDVPEGVMNCDEFPAGSLIDSWIPPLGTYIVIGVFIVKWRMIVDDKYYRTLEIEWTGSKGILREYEEAPPTPLVPIAMSAASGTVGLLLMWGGH